MEVEGLFAGLQAACAALSGPQRMQGEAKLRELAQTPSPLLLHLAQWAWQRSTDTVVLFNAGALLKGAIVRDWAQIDAASRAQLNQFLFQLLVERHTALEKAAMFQLVHGLCLLHKLWWHTTRDDAHGPENLGILTGILDHFSHATTLEAKRVGVELALNLVWEFSNVVPRCSEVGLTWEAHELCRLDFQDRMLPSLLRNTVALLAELCQTRTLQRFPALPNACLELLTHALSWNFAAFSLHRALNYHGREDATILTPPADWATLLLTDGFGSLLWEVQQGATPETAALVPPLYLQLASLNGPIFGNDAEAKGNKLLHFDRLLRLIFTVMSAATDRKSVV